MDSLIKNLSDVILYLILGFIFIRTYRFVRVVKNSSDYQHIIAESLVVGFVLTTIYKCVPFSVGGYIDIVGMITTSFIFAFLLSKIIESKFIQKFLYKFGIRQTFNQNIWNDVIDKEAAIFVSVENRDTGVITDGKLVLYESFERHPLIQLSHFVQIKDGEYINNFADNPERTILIDTSKYDNVYVTYYEKSEHIKKWR